MLSVQDLIKVYPGPVPAVRGVDFELTPGLFGLLGPNGAGKTTLMKMLATLLEPTAGTFTLNGIDGVQRPHEVRERLGYLPQDFGFYPNVSARSMLDYLAALKGVRRRGRRAYIGSLLEQVNLQDHGGKKLGTYSGGMRQRFGIAQALLGTPDFLIVDEPTAGLDPQERVRFYNLLGELARERVIVLSTHIVEDVRVLCRSFAILRDGKIVYRGTPSDLLASMEGRVFEGFLPGSEVEGFVRQWPVASSVVSGEEGAYRVRVVFEDPGASAPPDFSPVAATLEDAYFATGRAAPDRAATARIAPGPAATGPAPATMDA